MSRHLLVDRPDVQVVLGFDHMLRSFFGQVFKPADSGIACDGWPTRSGLGTRQPVESYVQLAADLDRHLQGWAFQRLVRLGADHDEGRNHLIRLIGVLRQEWQDGDDHPELPLPASLTGGR